MKHEVEDYEFDFRKKHRKTGDISDLQAGELQWE